MERKTIVNLRTAISLLTLALAACAQTAGVQSVGPDTYTTSAAAAPVRGGVSEARRLALAEANEHCAQMGRQVLVTNVDTRNMNLAGAGSAEVIFRCLDKSDPELRRPHYQ